ncbi:hypothetical protein MOQ72_43255, partial [Saccharopolyspora sp. K220]|nr:hypothetical protein [Saccharopolyspora soli]
HQNQADQTTNVRTRRLPPPPPPHPPQLTPNVTTENGPEPTFLHTLSAMLGEQVWRESGLGAPHDIEQMQRRITDLEQQVVDLKGNLAERDQELDAARAANRELITRLNSGIGSPTSR